LSSENGSWSSIGNNGCGSGGKSGNVKALND